MAEDPVQLVRLLFSQRLTDSFTILADDVVFNSPGGHIYVGHEGFAEWYLDQVRGAENVELRRPGLRARARRLGPRPGLGQESFARRRPGGRAGLLAGPRPRRRDLGGALLPDRRRGASFTSHLGDWTPPRRGSNIPYGGLHPREGRGMSTCRPSSKKHARCS